MKKSATTRWIKIIVSLKLNLENHKQLVCGLVQQFEVGFHVRHLYYARYTGLDQSSFEISAYTNADWAVIKKFFSHYKGVLKVEIVDRDSGSLAHAYAYQAVKRIIPFDGRHSTDDNDFLDVLHWMCNMRGMDYGREARLYCFAAMRLAHQFVLEADKNADIMRKFNARVRSAAIADSLVERLNLKAEKDPVTAKGSSGAPRRKRRQSAYDDADKASGSSRSRSSGSGRR